jgi:hypothetical protein
VRRLGGFGLRWAALFWLFLLYQGDMSGVDAAAAVIAATLAAGVAEAARAVAPSRARLEPSWAARALKVPWQIVVEFGIVAAALVRSPRGGGVFRTLRYPVAGATPEARARRALVAIAAAYSPNSYPVDVGDDGVVLVHDLVPRPGKELP